MNLTKRIFQNLISTLIIFCLISSCAAIPGKNVKLENYPEVKKDELKNIEVNYITKKFEPDRKGYSFEIDITEKFNRILKAKKNSNCKVEISTMHSAALPRTCVANYFVAGFTLFIIPYYCQHIFEAKASLIETKSNKTLKEYYLKDKAHEVWSLLMILAAIPITPLRELPSDDYGKRIVQDNISEALARQVLTDAANFKECHK